MARDGFGQAMRLALGDDDVSQGTWSKSITADPPAAGNVPWGVQQAGRATAG